MNCRGALLTLSPYSASDTDGCQFLSICIFFGPTPVSSGDQPRAYSPVNVFGRVLDNPHLFKSVPNGATIRITAAAA
ncbi:MAG: hypothetical protein JRD84_04200 [Deltaproteobacteria bacterium]|nr:hypothetical protein [Deltaproteobacteria bacterium]